MRSSKGSHRIVVRDIEYRWQAKGDDGNISIGIWPKDNVGAYIKGGFKYHETWLNNGDGSYSSKGDQIVVTNRIILRIIEYAIIEHHYDPKVKETDLNLKMLDEIIKWDDAVRPER
jgi:hypothetical protein